MGELVGVRDLVLGPEVERLFAAADRDAVDARGVDRARSAAVRAVACVGQHDDQQLAFVDMRVAVRVVPSFSEAGVMVKRPKDSELK